MLFDALLLIGKGENGEMKISDMMKGKQGGSTIFEIVIVLGLITFILFFPVAMFSYTQKATLMEDVLMVALQDVSINGGLTDETEELIYLNMELKNLLPKNSGEEERSQIIIKSNADARNGQVQNLKYRDDEDPLIKLEIWYPADREISLLNGLNRLIGGTLDQFPTDNGQIRWYYRLQGYIYSEKIDY